MVGEAPVLASRAMSCRACGLDHKPTIRCEVAARLASNAKPVTNGAVTNAGAVTNDDGKRVRAWRKANPDRYNAYQRDYMKRRRGAWKG